MEAFLLLPGALATAACLIGLVYATLALIAVLRFARGADRRNGFQPAVTILKPVCGEEPGLYHNLRSFCRQDYAGAVQIVIGAHRESDPAVAIARRLIADLPEADIALVVDGNLPGTNFKVCNLLNMMAVAKHEVLVVSDSDMRVEPHYLSSVVAPLEDPRNGLVTCLYKGTPAAPETPAKASGCGTGLRPRLVAMLPSILGSAFINYAFLPSVLAGRMLGAEAGCFGSTMALTRATLDRVGGFAVLLHQLADDYVLGSLIRALGLEVALSDYVIENIVAERDLAGLIAHELRWLRTVRSITPLGLAGSVITHPLALALVALPLEGFSRNAWLLLVASLAIRTATIHVCARVYRPAPLPLLLLPLRDLLSLALLALAFCSRQITWRAQRFEIREGGELTLEGDPLA